MTAAVSCRTLAPDDWRLLRAVRLAALAEAPYAFSTTLAEWQGSGDTEERWRNRLVSIPFSVVALVDDEPAGMICSILTEDGDAALLSMWVAPWARGRGIGDALVDEVVRWAGTQRAPNVVLEVYRSNRHAIALYERHGFVVDERFDPGDEEHRMICVLLEA